MKRKNLKAMKAKESGKNEIPESVLFRVITSKDIPEDIGDKIWRRSLALRDSRNEQLTKKENGQSSKFTITDNELEQITKS